MPSELVKGSKPKSTFTPKKFSKETKTLDKDMLKMLEEKYGITPRELEDNNIIQIANRHGLLMPLYNLSDYAYGHTTKYFDSEYKAVHYLTTDTSKLHFIRPRKRPTTVTLVEDVLSAIRVHRFNQGVALLGTNLTSAHVSDLKRLGVEELIIALDPDAINKAVKMKNQYGLFFSQTRVVSLSDDPKNLEHDELKKQLGV